MKDTKYKILAYFDNQSYRKLFNEINSDYAENLQILLHNLSLFSYDVLIIGVILYKENISNIISAIRKITQMQYIDYMPRKIAKQNDTYFEKEGNSLLACMQKGEQNE